MIILANLLAGVALVLQSVIQILIIVLIAYAVLSWVSPDPHNPIVRIIRSMCEPMLAPLRRKIPPVGPGIDLSPLILLLLLYFLNVFLVGSLRDFEFQIRRKALTSRNSVIESIVVATR